ncbi:cytidylyltransferase domain-containing protein [Paenibacillus sp. PAMC21692]|uniref:acylneuraminate cytidylyltransferase family protein n=1 Tax=Paenibacillus sp. PAMC21692 TaxID=2762320 RepID=UPI00164E8840|nr:acylneuraminate cytidylyltransferase family protein [Paenibacillus sp. PAMC21692]QNK58373.1 acylneuraminate cytidylyltransferase family protein [Paenibacillus sp. PAMC21692]
MLRIAAVVPIKLNNERLPNKNILPFDNGQPLMKYIQKTLLEVKTIDDIYIYCSDESIINYQLPGVKFKKRSEYLDHSATPFNEVLYSFAHDIKADYYVLSHATAPFLKSESIQRGLDMVTSGQYDSAIGVQRVHDFLWREGKPINFKVDNIPRTQDLPLIYAETCGLYIYSRELILRERRRVGSNPYFVELSKIESMDINDRDDFIIANSVFLELSKLTGRI